MIKRREKRRGAIKRERTKEEALEAEMIREEKNDSSSRGRRRKMCANEERKRSDPCMFLNFLHLFTLFFFCHRTKINSSKAR